MLEELAGDNNLFALFTLLAGTAGGIVSFVWSFQRGHYCNNKYRVKLSLEIVGSTLTAFFLVLVVSPREWVITTSFVLGLGWSTVVKVLRSKITNIVEAVAGEKDK